MFTPLTKADIGTASPDARLYCRPTGFVDRPHELGDDGLRIADTLVWFSAWHLSLRDGDQIRSAIVPVAQFADWLAAMPDHLAQAATRQHAAVARPRDALTLGERTVRLTEPQLVGIVNMTPDSLSGGGKHADPAAAIDAGFAMASAGAAIIDVGGESTRPGASLVWEGDEIKRIEPVVAGCARVVDDDEAAERHEALEALRLGGAQRRERGVAAPVEKGRLEDRRIVEARRRGLERRVDAGPLADLPCQPSRRALTRMRVAAGVLDAAHVEER